MNNQTVYLDYNASTPVDQAVADEMRPYFTEIYANPSGNHLAGLKARQAIMKSRGQVAAMLNASPDEIVFTSGGTESNNMAIRGVAHAFKNKGNHIITSAIEHPSVLEVCRLLQEEGFEITLLPVDHYGMCNIADLINAVKKETILISIMHSNNEVGTIQPIAEMALIARERGIVFHTDASQSVGKAGLDVKSLGIDLLTVAGHKFYGPKGMGAIYIKRGITLDKLIFGANHERNLRAGTENVPGIVGLGKAAEMAAAGLKANREHLLGLKKYFSAKILNLIPTVRLNGHPELCLPNTLSISFPNVKADDMIEAMPEIAVSPGAACHAGQEYISYVLQAMKVPGELAKGTLRFSFGKYSTFNEADIAVQIVANTYHKLTGEIDIDADYRQEKGSGGIGCGCKINPLMLREILGRIPVTDDPRVMVGFNSSDDAAVYSIDDKYCLVQTVDVINRVVDDPYDFGSVAAANAISDIYAMGVYPAFGLNIVMHPAGKGMLHDLDEIIKGASDKAAEAGFAIIGGHSIMDHDAKFGMVVNSIALKSEILTNTSAKAGDVLVLTKPIGTGIICYAHHKGLATKAHLHRAVEIMKKLNKTACETMRCYKVSACTDVTGFGLLGHVSEMLGNRLGVNIRLSSVPVLEEAYVYLAEGLEQPAGKTNRSFVEQSLVWNTSNRGNIENILFDPQTSGGLLIAVSPEHADDLVRALHASGLRDAGIIGEFFLCSEPEIKISD